MVPLHSCGKLMSSIGAFSLLFTGFSTNPQLNHRKDPDLTKTQKILRYAKSTLLVILTSQIYSRIEKPSLYLVFTITSMI